MTNKITQLFGLVCLVVGLLVGCGGEATPTAVAEKVVQPTQTAPPTAVPPTATSTVPPTATATTEPTATAVPTEPATPTPTAVPVMVENLLLALDYDRGTLAPLSPRDYFPLGVSYITAVFDYQVTTREPIYWRIRNENRHVLAEGSSRLNPDKQSAAIIAHLSDGLEEGNYEFSLQIADGPTVTAPFSVFWNPTIWPITLSTDWMSGNNRVSQLQFPAKTLAVVAAYPTVNFAVGDRIELEWISDGQKFGEYLYVWDNHEWSTGIHQNVIPNQLDPEAALPAGWYEIQLFVNDRPKQCQIFVVLAEDGSVPPTAVDRCASFTEELAQSEPINEDNTWDRYQPRSWADLQSLTDALLADVIAGSIYIETSEFYQYPSHLIGEYTGQTRPTPPERLFVITAWLRAVWPDMSDEEIVELFGTEVEVKLEEALFWFPMQKSPMNQMVREVEVGGQIQLYALWIGAIAQETGNQKLYLVNRVEAYQGD